MIKSIKTVYHKNRKLILRSCLALLLAAGVIAGIYGSCFVFNNYVEITIPANGQINGTNGEHADAFSDIAQGICDIFIASIATFLGVTITSYIFLHTELQTRKKSNLYMRQTINKLLKDKCRELMGCCFVGLVCIIAFIVQYEVLFKTKCFLILSSCGAFGYLIWVIVYNARIINHDSALFHECLELLNKEKKILIDKIKHLKEYDKIQFENLSISELESSSFFKEVSDLQKITERVIANHGMQLEGTPENTRIDTVFVNKEDGSIDQYATMYKKIYSYRDLLFMAVEMCPDSGKDAYQVQVPSSLPSHIEGLLIKNHAKDELLRKIELSAKKYSDGDFSGTSFDDSLLSEVVFDKCDLRNSSFENCRLVDVQFNNPVNVTGINFRRAIIKANFSNGIEFSYCNFSEADFSKQDDLYCIKFDNSTFKMANFIGEEGSTKITKCSMVGTLCTKAKFGNSYFKDSDFSSSDMSETDLSNVIVEKCKLMKTNFQLANFYYSIIIDSKMEDCRLSNASLINSKIERTDMAKAYGTNVSFRSSLIKDQTVLDYALLNSSDFSYATLEDLSIRNTTFSNSIFVQVAASKVDFSDSIFIGAQFIDGANSLRKEYKDCNFSDCLFNDAILDGVRFINCKFYGCCFDGAIVKKVDFLHCEGLTMDSFRKAAVDDYTLKDLVNTSSMLIEIKYENTNEHNDWDETCRNIISSRRSIRSFQKDVPLDRKVIDRILTSAIMAPSAKNRQPWKFYVIDSAEGISNIVQKIHKLNASSDHPIEEAARIIENVSALVFVQYEFDGNEEHRNPDTQSIGAAIENLLLQATAMGVGSLWMCDPLCYHEELKSFLKLDNDFLAVIALGEIEDSKLSMRKPIDDVRRWYDV